MVDILDEIGEPQDASDWLIAMREQPDDPVLQQKFETWLLSSPENAEAWQEANQLGAMLRELRPDHARGTNRFAGYRAGAVEVSHQVSHSSRISRFSRSQRFAMAAGSMAIVLLLVVLNGLTGLGPENVYETATAETRVIELSDQSRIDLAPDSIAEIAYNDGIRHVVLHKGTAFFDVMPNKQRPFVVSAKNLSVQVLGTAFEVRTNTVKDEVSVAEGRVEVTGLREGKHVNLTVGDSVVVDTQSGWHQNKVPLESISAWRRGLIVAQNERLGDLIDEISDYYNGYLLVVDDSLQDVQISGVFDVSHPDRALEIIGKSHGLNVRTVTPWVTILSKK